MIRPPPPPLQSQKWNNFIKKGVYKTGYISKWAAKIRVFVFESFDVLNLYLNLIGESVEKIWLRFSDPWWKI
jgi:tRNA G46 methylase TrmB